MAYFGSVEALTPAHLKLAEAPQHSELIDYTLPDSGQASKFPLLRVNNIYVLPGGLWARQGRHNRNLELNGALERLNVCSSQLDSGGKRAGVGAWAVRTELWPGIHRTFLVSRWSQPHRRPLACRPS